MMIGGMLRKALIIVGGTGVAQLVSVGVLPLLLRIYSPAEFGFFAVFSAACWIVAVFATFQLEHRVILQRTRRHADQLAQLIILISISVAFFAALLSWGLTGELRDRFSTELVAPYLAILVFVTVSGISLTQALRAWLVREGHFHLVSRGTVVTSVVTAVVALVPAAIFGDKYRFYGLPVAQASGLLVTALIWLILSRISWQPMTQRRSYLRLLGTFSRERSIGLILMLSNATKTAYARLPTFIVSGVGGAIGAGHFGLVERVVSAPSTLLAQAVGIAFRNHAGAAAAKRDQHTVIRLYWRTVLTAFLVATPIYLVAATLAPTLFSFAFGANWRIAGEYAGILLLGEIFVFSLTTVTDAAVLMDMNRYRLYWHLGQFSAMIALWGFCMIGLVKTVAGVCWALVLIRVGFALVDIATFSLTRHALIHAARDNSRDQI